MRRSPEGPSAYGAKEHEVREIVHWRTNRAYSGQIREIQDQAEPARPKSAAVRRSLLRPDSTVDLCPAYTWSGEQGRGEAEWLSESGNGSTRAIPAFYGPRAKTNRGT